MSRLAAIFREALATARSQPVASVVSLVIVAGMVATVLLTTGRTVGAEQAVLGSIDSAGTRSIVVRAEESAGVDASVIDRIAHIEGVAWSGGFGAAQDVTNIAVPGGTKVPVRTVWSNELDLLGIYEVLEPGHSAWASELALTELGMSQPAGGVETSAGGVYSVSGSAPVPDFLSFLEPLLLVPQDEFSSPPGSVSVLVVVAARPDLVVPVAEAVQSVLGADDPTKVSITTSEDLATLRALVEGQLGAFGRNLVLVVFAVTALLVAAILYGLVILRRKDFGRRRALGASQSLIIALLLIQQATVAVIGAITGGVLAIVMLAIGGDPLPGVAFTVAVILLAVLVSIAAALLPAIAAARRDPLSELRVP
jgi:putative ABC transport system permease protein